MVGGGEMYCRETKEGKERTKESQDGIQEGGKERRVGRRRGEVDVAAPLEGDGRRELDPTTARLAKMQITPLELVCRGR